MAMKLIHCADIHLGSPMDSVFTYDKAEERKAEVRAAFSRMLDFAKAEKVKVVMISGDLFDSDRPTLKDKKFFYSCVRSHPEIDFLYLKGNHDKEQGAEEELANLKTFSQTWTKYSYPEVDIYGIEGGEKGENAPLYGDWQGEEERKNIVMLHGQIGASRGKDKIDERALRGRNVDYYALGHIHSYQRKPLDERGEYAYSGCLIGRGFDEEGEKGFLLLEIDDEGKISVQKVNVGGRKIVIVKVDVSGSFDAYSAYRIVEEKVEAEREDIVRIILIGRISYNESDLAQEVERYLRGRFYVTSVKDETEKEEREEEYLSALSLRGEFVRAVRAREDLSKEDKEKIVSYGLQALRGEEIDEEKGA